MKQRTWQVAILTAAGALGASSTADAALFYWQDNDPGYYYRPEPQFHPRRQKVRRPAAKKVTVQKDTAARPQGPLIVAVSIQNQKVRIYDANGLFAESPVSTGMPGHSTPTGIFSVIQKQRYHVSNIYSGAPMPYMQRITWSGVAMHAGVLPGYPASHGCIRMPMSFAVKMWGWTRMGARVVITPGEVTPVSFSHPLLAAYKVPPQPVATDQPVPNAPFGVKGDKGADAEKPANGPNFDLRTTVGNAESSSLRERTHTADASDAMPAATASATMSDATPSAMPEASSAKPEAADADPITARLADDAASEDERSAAGPTATKAAETAVDDAAGRDVFTSASAKAEVKANEIGSDSAKTDASSAVEPKSAETKAERPAETTKVDAPPMEVKKDSARLPGGAKPALPMRTGQIAVFISRKDSRLYVRQNFAPLFDVPVTIAPSDRPLGTHVFTAVADKDDSNVLRWSAMTLPVSQRHVARNDDDRASRHRKTTGTPAESSRPSPSSNSATEALDRITVPADVIAHINQALGTGGSIVVSDLGLGQSSETGQGTDFIIPLR